MHWSIIVTQLHDYVDSRNVEDIDLVTAALSEVPVEGSVIGPTFLCLLGRTFRNARLGMFLSSFKIPILHYKKKILRSLWSYLLAFLGDRYWYENGNTPGSFTIEQLEEIRKCTMAKLLCDNGDRLRSVQPRAFILKDPFL